jgi:hypothetical protein
MPTFLVVAYTLSKPGVGLSNTHGIPLPPFLVVAYTLSKSGLGLRNTNGERGGASENT